MVLDKHLTKVMNCLQNVVNIFMLLYFLELSLGGIIVTARTVSPVESWKGLFYNMWTSLLVVSMMTAFKDTLEALILFENFKRARDGRKDATTIIAVDENRLALKHVNNDTTSTGWQAIACWALEQFLNKVEKKNEGENAKDASAQNEDAATPVSTGDELKQDANTDDELKQDAATDDELKQDAGSASSSARSSAETTGALN